MKRNPSRIKNVFFIQRAAIDILLINKASAIEICTYLVICKYTDRHGYESGVGFKTIKERLGVGQRKISEALRRLKSIEYKGQRLLYSVGEWIYLKTGSLPRKHDDIGWIRGWFESGYKHNVWLNSDLVGDSGDKERPLNYFVKVAGRDNHLRMLLLLYKYHIRHYSGVNYRFASIMSEKIQEKEICYKISGFEFFKSRLGSYHISQNVLNKIGISITYKETCNILDELQKNSFINVSVSVLGWYAVPSLPSKIVKKRSTAVENNEISDRTYSDKQLKSWKYIQLIRDKYKKLRSTFTLTKIPVEKGSKTFSIGLKRIYTEAALTKMSAETCEKLMDLPGELSFTGSQFIYRLDYKSSKKRILKLSDCLAVRIERIVQKNGLEAVSRKGKFYNSYWWFNPGVNGIDLVGILMPTHIPSDKLSSSNDAVTSLEELNNSENDMEIIVNSKYELIDY